MGYIPDTNNEFDTFQDTFISKTEPKLAEWKITPEQFQEVKDAQKPWVDAWKIAKDKPNRSPSETEAKNKTKKALESALRNFIQQYIVRNKLVSSDDKKSIGAPIYDTTKTPVPVPEIEPVVQIEKIGNLRHQLRMTNPETPDSRALPEGVIGIEVYAHVGDAPPESDSDFRIIGTSTRFRFTSKFLTSELKQEAYYKARYINTKGEPGPFSTVIQAVVA